MTEQDVWVDILKRGKILPTAFWNRIESGSTVAGVPDIHVIKNAAAPWIESKVFRSNRMKLRPGQPGWHKKYAMCGGMSWLMGYYEAADLTALIFYKGARVDELMESGLAYVEHPIKVGRQQIKERVVALADHILRIPVDAEALDRILFGSRKP